MDLNDTQARIEAQLALETLATEMGIAAYHKALADEGVMATSPGQQLLKAAISPMLEALKKWLAETGEGLASRNAGTYHFINHIDPLVVAYTAANSALNNLHDIRPLAQSANYLTSNLEAALNYESILEQNPNLAAKVKRMAERQGSDAKRCVLIRKGAQLIDAKFIQWDEKTRVRIGTTLLHLFAESTGLVAMETVYLKGNRTSISVRPTESCRMWLEESHARCELLTPARIPMVCPPRDWTHPFNGGYLGAKLRQPLVKTRNRGYLTALKEHSMPWVYASVNALQATEWAVNKGVLEVIRALWEQSVECAGLPSRDELPLPGRSWAEGDDPPAEVLTAWKVKTAKVYEANAKMASKRNQVVQKLWVADKMIEHGNRFHFVYNLDWRGRMYPVGSSLTPQGDDSAKALLQFAQCFHLGNDGAYWLAVHGANSFGVDKVSFEERIEWIEAHSEAIEACGKDPLVNRWWQDADSPFVFLAFCMEWAALQAHVDRGGAEAAFPSHLAVAFDGSCNGLQNFSAMLRDPVGGKATGLIPSDIPADIYTEVRDATQSIIDQDAADTSGRRVGAREARKAVGGRPAADAREGTPVRAVAARWVGKMTRQLAKRNTMTVPYGVTARGMRDQLFGELADSLPEHRSDDATYLAACNYAAIGTVVVAARQAMDWLRDAAKVAASTGLPVRWLTPAGFLAVQDYRDAEGEEADFTVLGRRYRLMLEKTGEKLNTRRQALGISPNYVHSLDAAHLMRTVLFCAQDGMSDFAMIHDSYGVHAGHASRLRDNLREAFVEQYKLPVLEQFRDELREQLPPEMKDALPELPPMGTLDLEQVRTSEYFFA